MERFAFIVSLEGAILPDIYCKSLRRQLINRLTGRRKRGQLGHQCYFALVLVARHSRTTKTHLVTGVAHAMGDLAMAATLIAFCSRQSPLVTVSSQRMQADYVAFCGNIKIRMFSLSAIILLF
jgi:hypothetical protein